MNFEMQQIIRKRKIKIRIFLCIVALLVIASIGCAVYMQLRSQGRIALRETKNAVLMLEYLTIEEHGEGTKIYDEDSEDGLTDFSRKRLKNDLSYSGEIKLMKYDDDNNRVKELSYTKGKYQVFYSFSEKKGEKWTVNYYITIIN